MIGAESRVRGCPFTIHGGSPNLATRKINTKRMQVDNMNSAVMRPISNIAPGQPLPSGSGTHFSWATSSSEVISIQKSHCEVSMDIS